jgi:hypothetical protein
VTGYPTTLPQAGRLNAAYAMTGSFPDKYGPYRGRSAGPRQAEEAFEGGLLPAGARLAALLPPLPLPVLTGTETKHHSGLRSISGLSSSSMR